MNEFFSRRNQVYPTLFQRRAAVKKCFDRQEDWLQELRLYGLLDQALPLPRVLWSSPQVLITEYLPFPHLLSVLEGQARSGFDPAPWEQLGHWLESCKALCGELPSDGNLRSFLWDEEGRRIVGLDLEGYEIRSIGDSGADLVSSLLEYALPPSDVQVRIAELMLRRLHISVGQIQQARDRLLRRRHNIHSTPVTGVVLAGGQSKRMGWSKAELPLMGMTLLERQVNKLQRLGCREILISGPKELELPGTRAAPDLYPQRGPLGGLHACLSAASTSRCLVLAVDIPLVPLQLLDRLYRRHTSGVTLVTHQGRWEPLLAVYDSALSAKIPPLLADGGAPVRQLLEQTQTTLFHYSGPELFLENCNTPRSYQKVCAAAEIYHQHDISLLKDGAIQGFRGQ